VRNEEPVSGLAITDLNRDVNDVNLDGTAEPAEADKI
jgi:hypothetical protein